MAATFETEGDMEYAVNSFAGSMAESQMLSGCHFFKVYVDGELEYVLLTKSSAEDAYMVGKLAVCQIRTLVSAYMEQFDRNNFMQNILLGNMLVVDMYNKAQKLHIEQAERVVFVIELEGKGRYGDRTGQESVRGEDQGFRHRGGRAKHCAHQRYQRDGRGRGSGVPGVNDRGQYARGGDGARPGRLRQPREQSPGYCQILPGGKDGARGGKNLLRGKRDDRVPLSGNRQTDLSAPDVSV